MSATDPAKFTFGGAVRAARWLSGGLFAAASACQPYEPKPVVDADADGFVAWDDCDDEDAAVFPGAVEACNGVDDDCDARIDEDPDLIGYFDGDGDGYGDVDQPMPGCVLELGAVANADDCDDTNREVHPGAAEVCDGDDDNCDGIVDRDVADAPSWYPDADGDGHGAASGAVTACAAPTGFVSDSADCNDADAGVHGGVAERCNGIDDDCDGATDEAGALDTRAFYLDADDDGFGAESAAVYACDAPDGYVDDTSDCDDSDADVHPGTAESCNGVDDDCDGETDDVSAFDARRYYRDLDGDAHGTAATSELFCGEDAPTGWAVAPDDCDDADADAGPAGTWYKDADGDGYGVGSTTTAACEPPSGFSNLLGDCDDTAAHRFPGAPERCSNDWGGADGYDDDCDTSIDEACPVDHCGDITVNTTWSAATAHRVSCDIDIRDGARLTIVDGAKVSFAPGTSLRVGVYGVGLLVVSGTSAGVVMTSDAVTPAPGDWSGVHVGSSGNAQINGLTLEYAGGNYADAALRIDGGTVFVQRSTVAHSETSGVRVYGGTPRIIDSDLVDNAAYGLDCGTAPCLLATADSFAGNLLTGNAAPMRIVADAVGSLAATSQFTGNTKDFIELVGSTVTRSARWHDLGVPYRADALVVGDVTHEPVLTLEDGVEVEFTSGALAVGNSARGDLVVEGDVDGVRFTSANPRPLPGDWSGVLIGYQATSTTHLVGATIEYGGGSNAGLAVTSPQAIEIDGVTIQHNANGGLRADGNAQIDVHDALIQHNLGDGVRLQPFAGFTAPFERNTVTGNSGYPVAAYADDLGALSASSAYVGNGVDRVFVRPATVTTDQTWRALDVPYLFEGFTTIGHAANQPVVTIEDGVETYWLRDSGLQVGTSNVGDLRVEGNRTTGVGVRFQSVYPELPGQWMGISFGYAATSRSRMSGFVIEGAGQFGSSPGGLVVQSFDGLEISGGLIQHTLRNGLYVHDASVALETTEIKLVHSSNPANPADGDGVRATASAAFTGWANNLLTLNDRFPAYIDPSQMASLDVASTYTGNGRDQLAVSYGTVSQSGTWRVLGVPWYITGIVSIQCAGCASPVEITATDATFEFSPYGVIRVGDNYPGDFRASGCAFTSARAEPRAGDWGGLFFAANSSARSLVTASSIAFGGQSYSGTLVGNLVLDGARGTFTNNLITDSLNIGIRQHYSPSAVVSGNMFARNGVNWSVSP